MRNVVEDLVHELYDELRPGVANWSDTPENREDVMVYTLNRVPAHYVTTLKGEVITRMDLLKDQLRADATVALLEAFRFIGAKPRPSGGAAKH